MKHYIIEYLVVVLLIMGADAFMSFEARLRYQLLYSFLAAIFWPITLPFAVFIAVRKTRHLPKGSKL